MHSSINTLVEINISVQVLLELSKFHLQQKEKKKKKTNLTKATRINTRQKDVSFFDLNPSEKAGIVRHYKYPASEREGTTTRRQFRDNVADRVK